MRSTHRRWGVLTGFLALALASVGAGEEPSAWWLFLRDKGPGPQGDEVPVYAAYVAAIARVAQVRQTSRWFNAVSVDATPAELDSLRALPFVSDSQPVAFFAREPEPTAASAPRPARAARTATRLDYGYSLSQNTLVGAVPLHELGFDGGGITIAVLDAGFDDLPHPAFASVRIARRYDFVDNDTTVDGDTHGSEVLSVLAGDASGDLIGPAYAATFLLARTEISDYESPVEEDKWVAGIEWAASLGARIVSSSIGYNTFDDPRLNHTLSQLDGKTTVITRAAQKAAGKGIVVITAAGNERGYYGGVVVWHGKLLFPADGDSVIAVGAAYSDGSPTGFTSFGPTADGRIKPDVSAVGYGVVVAMMYGPSPDYGPKFGTSYATPLISGVAAMLLQAHPGWDPIAVRTALRMSGARALAPDTTVGWGMISGLRALGADSAFYGQLVDSTTKAPVSGSYVTVTDASDSVVARTSVSDAGWFRFEHLPPGTYRVRGYWVERVRGVDTTISLPHLPRELHLKLGPPTAIAEGPLPTAFWVGMPFPNPANPTTAIRYRLPAVRPGDIVRLRIVSAAGQTVRELREHAALAGTFIWDGRDATGRRAASGVYLAELSAGQNAAARRVVLVR